MKSYAINRISKDLIEFALTYDIDEFNDINEQVFEVLKYNSFTIDENDYINNEIYKTVLSNMLLDDVDFINNNDLHTTLVRSLIGKARIIKINEEEIMIIFNVANVQEDISIKLPSFKEISKIKMTKKDESDSIINYILINNGFIKKEDVEEFNVDTCVEVDMYGKSVLLYDSFSIVESEFELIGSLEDKRVGDEVAVKNTLMNNRIEKHKISKIYSIVAEDLSDEIVKKLNYHNTKTKEEFCDLIKKQCEKIDNFAFYLNEIYKSLTKDNNFNVTKYLFEFASTVIDWPNLGILSKENKYDLIKSRIIKAFLEEKYYNKDGKIKYDTSYLNPIFKLEYDILKLLNNLFNTDFDTYLETRQEDALLYTLVKNGGFKYD